MDEPLPKSLDPRRTTMSDLVGIASAVEQEAARRYSQLAELMQRRGETATAEAFLRMLGEERRHVAIIAEWAQSLDEPVPPAGHFEWRLPPELSASWDDIAGSALLTPYRALAIAVRNEERAFSMYSYLAAHAEDPFVARQAERLAVQALRHAAVLRRWRRAAYRLDLPRTRRPEIRTIEALQAFIAGREAEIAGYHRALAKKLRGLGDDESAQLLESLVEAPDQASRPAAVTTCDDSSSRPSPLSLLVAAQKPLEAFSEELETILTTTSGPISAAAEEALSNVIARLARIAYHAERRA